MLRARSRRAPTPARPRAGRRPPRLRACISRPRTGARAADAGFGTRARSGWPSRMSGAQSAESAGLSRGRECPRRRAGSAGRCTPGRRSPQARVRAARPRNAAPRTSIPPRRRLASRPGRTHSAVRRGGSGSDRPARSWLAPPLRARRVTPRSARLSRPGSWIPLGFASLRVGRLSKVSLQVR